MEIKMIKQKHFNKRLKAQHILSNRTEFTETEILNAEFTIKNSDIYLESFIKPSRINNRIIL